MKKLLIIPVALFLAGCQSTQPNLIQNQIVVVKPDPSFYNCPVVSRLPNKDSLTDLQVAKLLVQLYKHNKSCKNSLDYIQKFLDEAEEQYKR